MKWFLWGALSCAACAAAGPNDQAEPATAEDGKSPEGVAATDGDDVSSSSEPDAPTAVPKDAKPEPVAGPFNEERVQEIVRANFSKMGDCYAKGLQRDPSLKGTINVSLTIDDEGVVVRAVAPKSDKPKPPPPPPRKLRYWEKKPKEPEEVITDTEVVTCVEGEFKLLRFPPTGRGLITLLYPIVLRTE